MSFAIGDGRFRHREGSTGEVVILDNRDSFVFNLAHRFEELGRSCVVVRSDAISVDELEAWRPAALVVSPGPGHPDDAGISIEAIRRLAGVVPILGVCLGHQAIAVAFGGRVEANAAPRHGKASAVEHGGRGLFEGLESPLQAGRYHALVAVEPLPDVLDVTARVDGFVMGLQHRELAVYGVQFHPESVLTPGGYGLLRRFLAHLG